MKVNQFLYSNTKQTDSELKKTIFNVGDMVPGAYPAGTRP